MPILYDSIAESLLFWDHTLETQLAKLRNYPRFVIVPNQSSWCDIIIGDPLPQEFRPIRLSPEQIPETLSDPKVPVTERYQESVQRYRADILETEETQRIPPFIKRISKPAASESPVAGVGAEILDEIKDWIRWRRGTLMAVLAVAIIGTVGLVVTLTTMAMHNAGQWRSLCNRYAAWFQSFPAAYEEHIARHSAGAVERRIC